MQLFNLVGYSNDVFWRIPFWKWKRWTCVEPFGSICMFDTIKIEFQVQFQFVLHFTFMHFTAFHEQNFTNFLCKARVKTSRNTIHSNVLLKTQLKFLCSLLRLQKNVMSWTPNFWRETVINNYQHLFI